MAGGRPAPRAHWVLLFIGLAAAALLLATAAYAGGSIGERSGRPSSPAAPAAVRSGGPVLDAAHPDRPGLSAPDRTVALTFDDGPGPWTPRVLAVLERAHVPATFFVVGKQVVQHRGAIRRMIGDGDEIGIHTFTHPDLGSIPGWRERAEINDTQLVLASVSGRTTDLLRLPYSSVPPALTAADMRAIGRAGNYRVVLADVDTRDWSRPGVEQIVDAALAAGSKGVVVMLHDGGGDRSQTVAALPAIIDGFTRRGFTFATVTDALGLKSPWHRATLSQRFRGAVLVALVRLSEWFAGVLTVLIVALGAVSVLRIALVVFFAHRHARDGPAMPPADYAPPVSVVVPAFNEAVGIAAAVRSLCASDYPEFEVVVVDDGSTDGTADIVAALGLPSVSVIRQANAGKPAALNAGIAAARHDVVVMVDGDTRFESGTLRALVAPLADHNVGAVSGNTKVGNRKGLLGRWQHIEYVMGFNLDRRMFDVLQCMTTVPGAIGAFRRDALAHVGLVSSQTLAEDTDLTIAICRSGWRVVYAPDARAWTEAPATLSDLWKQRYRWCYGTMQTAWKHRRAVVETGPSGRIGRRGLLYLVLFQFLLPMMAPVVDLAAVYGLALTDPALSLEVWLGFLGMQTLAALYAFRLDGESPRALWSLPLQVVVYRQLMYLVIIQSASSALYGTRLRWQQLRRVGRLEAPPDAIR